MGDNEKVVDTYEIDDAKIVGVSEIIEEGKRSSKAHGGTKMEGVVKVEETEALTNKKFSLANQGSEWYEHLLPRGRCDDLLQMVKGDPSLLWQKGKGGVTVLHKAIHHQHMALVHHVVEDMFDDNGISTHFGNHLTLGDLLCDRDDRGITAVMLASVIGPWDGILTFERAITRCDRNEAVTSQTLKSGIVNTEKVMMNNKRAIFRKRLMASHPTVEMLAARSLANAARIQKSAYQDVIEPIVKDILDSHDLDIAILKRFFEERDDYNCTRTEEFFFHFLCGCCEVYNSDDGLRQFRWRKEALRTAQKIVDKVKDHSDVEDLVFDLFDHLDPQGRTPLHVAGMAGFQVGKAYNDPHCGIVHEVLQLIPKDNSYDQCVNVRDGGGCTILHQSCIMKNPQDFQHILEDGRVDFNARLDINARVDWDPNSGEELGVHGHSAHCLLHWRSVRDMEVNLEKEFYPTALHLLILHGHDDLFKIFLESKGHNIDVNARVSRGSLNANFTPLQLAAALGREKMVKILLEHKEVKDNGKMHGIRDEAEKYSAIHIAAAYKRLKVLQILLENKKLYDPMIATSPSEPESPLHLVAMTRKLPDPILPEDISLEGDANIIQRCLRRGEVLIDDKLQMNYDANDIVCINIILQVGFDIWCSDKDGREPYPGVDASIEAYKWWYERVASEVSSYKQKLNGATSAISVIATLVATAAFIGPLQPPLGYDDVEDHVQSNYVLIKIYFVCNALSFYFAVASLLAAVTPTIPMLRESTQDEIRRSQRSSKIAMSLLLISIIAILVSFSSSSIVVMRPKPGNDRAMILCTIGIGVATCVVILVMFTFRMISQMLNQPDLMRRFWPSKRPLLTKRVFKKNSMSS